MYGACIAGRGEVQTEREVRHGVVMRGIGNAMLEKNCPLPIMEEAAPSSESPDLRARVCAPARLCVVVCMGCS